MKRRGVIFLIFICMIFIIFGIVLAEAASLPTVGGDTDTWGDILNAYLQVQHNASGQHTNITSTDIITKNPVTDVRAFGAVGDSVTDDTAAIQAAMDFVEAQGGGTLFFPRGTYIITSTITWKNGVRLEGEQGGFLVPGRFTEIKWGGAVNGTLFVAEQIDENWQMTDATRLTFRGSGTNNPKTLIDFRDRIDYGTTFWKCQFANTNGDALVFRKGAANFYMYDFRADGIGGYLLYVNGSYGSVYNIDKFVYDAGNSADVADGLIFFDGGNAPNNANSRILISNAKMDVNSNLSEGNNSLILLGVNPSISDYVQYHLILENVWMESAAGVENLSLIKSTPASDQFFVVGTNVQVESKDEIISGSVTPGPIKGKLHPFFVFAPFVSGAPGANNQIVSLIGKTYIPGQFGVGIANAMENFAVNGSFKVQNASGTIGLYLNDSMGYIGIGTTRPQTYLEIASASASIIYLNRTGARNWKIASDGAGSFWFQMISPSINAFKLNSSGGISFIGSAVSDTQMDIGVYGAGVYNLLKLRNLYTSDNNQGVKILFSSRTINTSFANVAGIAGIMTDNNNTQYKGALVFYTANGSTLSEKMRIDSLGTLILTSNTTAIVCNAITEGGIIYSDISKKYYGCNLSNWNELY